MANSARIDELEKKFSENARRYFAPLANEYRKAGDLDRAIEICRAHLPQQPGHMSGHVVYGQALYESRQLDEAKTVFEAALALDPENLIALRHLGDIARDGGDSATARAWYLRVLDADPRNDEVAAMLAELDAAGSATPAAPAAATAAPADSVGWGDINPERASGGASAPADDTADPIAAQAQESGEESADRSEPLVQSASGKDVGGDAETDADTDTTRAADTLQSQGTVRPAPASLDRMLNDAFAAEADTLEMEPLPLSGSRGAASGDKGLPTPPVADDQTFAEVDALFDEISPPRDKTGSQRSVTGAQPAQRDAGHLPSDASSDDKTGDALFGDDATADTLADDEGKAVAGLETTEFVSPSRAPSGRAARRDTGSMAVTGLTSFDQPTEEDSSTRAAFVTETMAELYLQQGFTEEALDIYRQLLAQNPEDANLRDRIDTLERGGRTSLSVAAVSSEIIEAAKQRHATRPVRTVRSFFGRLAGRRAPHNPSSADPENGDDLYDVSADAGGSETASGASSPVAPPERLDLVGGLFGDAPVNDADERAATTLSSGFSSGAFSAPERPTESSASPTPVRSAQGGRAAHAGGSELSLDQVFRESPSRNPRKSGAYSFDQFFSDGTPGNQGGAQSGGSADTESSEAPEGDLEQFTAWLEGLKRK
jgi:tetratricopeptide (TPR) repeat protein